MHTLLSLLIIVVTYLLIGVIIGLAQAWISGERPRGLDLAEWAIDWPVLFRRRR